jgi:hypothetical protein
MMAMKNRPAVAAPRRPAARPLVRQQLAPRLLVLRPRPRPARPRPVVRQQAAAVAAFSARA